MARTCCLAAVDPERILLLGAALKAAGEPTFSVMARLDVVELRKLAPSTLVIDVDRLQVDPLEMVRRLRFVLPECELIVYTDAKGQPWPRECHLAGATCILSKDSTEAQLTSGLRQAQMTGCWTDPRFAAAV